MMTVSASQTVKGTTDHPIWSAFAALLKKLHCWYRRHHALKDARAAFMHTVYLEDRLLDDMGVTKEEVLWAASLPLEENAALALQARAAEKRAAEQAVCGRR
ncbi:MAG: hypothetical protein ACR2P3_07755 [Geminicoccaceae bacterium]